MQSKDSGWKAIFTNLIKINLKNEGTLWVSINCWTPYPPPPPPSPETDHVLLVFFLGHFFFLSSQKEGIVMVPWCLIFEPPLARPPWQTVVLEMFWMIRQSPPHYLVLERSLYLLGFLWLWASQCQIQCDLVSFCLDFWNRGFGRSRIKDA